MKIADYILILIFSYWFILSACAQAKLSFVGKWHPNDWFRLIPNWRFFAPLPIRNDFRLEYRYLLASGIKTQWATCLTLPERKIWCTIWYPEKRQRKALTTALNRIKKTYESSGLNRAAKTNSYLCILNYLQHLETPRDCKCIKFRAVFTQDFNPNATNKVVFYSHWHKCCC
ncbi:hypothetical protein SAMN04487890_11069 [Mucilaginibacter polytrichastri]|nr:hypothetical protein SAMN04487890_11069 [Mucilaginibacter polytrichastri]